MTKSMQDLALSAALLPVDQAVQSWESLRVLSTIEEMDHSVTRILPSVFRNCRNALPAEDLPKLRGSSRHTWAKNTEFFNQIRPLLKDLSLIGIPYRVLKGGAINLIDENPNFRVMGDIDLLIHKRDFAKLKDSLRRTGFKPKYSYDCRHSNRGPNKLELNYCSSGTLEIDIHLAEDKSERPLFLKILKEPPLIQDYLGLSINLPQIHFLIAHAIIHGELNVQEGDRAQTILDIALLLPKADPLILTKLIRDLHLEVLFNRYIYKLDSLTANTDFREFEIPRESRHRSLDFSKILWKLRQSTEAVFLVLNNRPPKVIHSLNIFNLQERKKFLYLVWLYTGMVRPLESFIIKRFGGFVPINGDTKNISINSASQFSNDWRFGIAIPPDMKRLRLRFESISFANQSFLAFANGELVGVTENNSSNQYLLVLNEPSSPLEISLRLPISGCKKCSDSMEDLKVTLL